MSSDTGDNNGRDQLCGDGASGGKISSKNECTSCEQNNIDTITKVLNSLALPDDKSICSCCGKEGNSDNMNTCNKCKMVKYCNAACKKKHRTKHKKACERRVAELHEEALFKEHPPNEECPICMQPLPHEPNVSSFMSCCGKTICSGCIYSIEMESKAKDLCAFCRTPHSSSYEEEIERINKLIDKGNGEAYYSLGGGYLNGELGLPQDMTKATELFLKAGELGYAEGYYNCGVNYCTGRGVEVDMKKANYYFELAAMNGHIKSRHNLGAYEGNDDNYHRATKHYIIAAKAGYDASLERVKIGYKLGLVTKDEYASTLRAYHERRKEMKSDMRDEAKEMGYGQTN